MKIAREMVDLTEEEAFDLYGYVDSKWGDGPDYDPYDCPDMGCSMISIDDSEVGEF